MAQQEDPQEHSYPTGRGYGNDYMRGGEVLGGYGYSARSEYSRRRGERDGAGGIPAGGTTGRDRGERDGPGDGLGGRPSGGPSGGRTGGPNERRHHRETTA